MLLCREHGCAHAASSAEVSTIPSTRPQLLSKGPSSPFPGSFVASEKMCEIAGPRPRSASGAPPLELDIAHLLRSSAGAAKGKGKRSHGTNYIKRAAGGYTLMSSSEWTSLPKYRIFIWSYISTSSLFWVQQWDGRQGLQSVATRREEIPAGPSLSAMAIHTDR